jgi:histidinol-phosphate aminotransferase
MAADVTREPKSAGFARLQVQKLPPYNAGLSAQEVKSRYGVQRVAKLGSNENPVGPSRHAVAAASDALLHVSVYPDASASGLRGAIGKAVGVDADRVIVANGSESILEMLATSFLDREDRVVTLEPSFGLHEIYPQMMGAVVDKVPVTQGFEWDIRGFKTALSRPAKMLILTNPSNPVGCWMNSDQFRDVIDAAPLDTLLVVDEAYYEYAKGDGYPDSIAELHKQCRPWIVLRTFSKAYGLAGLRVGYGIASSREVIDVLNRVRTPFNVNEPAQAAAAAAFADQAHVQKCVGEVASERARIRKQLESLGLFVAPSRANFLFVNVGRPAMEVAERLLRDGVIVKPWKEAGYETFIRVSVGAPEDNSFFLRAIEHALNSTAAA